MLFVWFVVRQSEFGERAENRVLESEIDLGSGFKFDDGVDVEALDIDPIKGMCFLCFLLALL